jgi:ribonuclease VapC
MGLNIKNREAAALARQPAAATGESVTSAVTVSILRGEPDADRYVEAPVVIDANRDPVLSGRFDDLLVTATVRVEPVPKRHAKIARQAYRDLGKGSGLAAGLNLGDCFAYALVGATGEPLLFTGDDFAQTDVASGLGQTTEGR